jgi:hypothetical protein
MIDNKFNKIEFILSFAAIIIGLSVFRDDITKIPFNFASYDIELWRIVLYVSLILLCSVYLYALDSIRYSINRIDGWGIFKKIQQLADLLYTLAVVSPILIFITWLAGFLLSKLSLIHIDINNSLISLISVILSISAFIIIFIEKISIKNKLIREETSKKVSSFVLKSDKLMKNGEWRLFIVETFRLLELILRDKAFEIGIDMERISFPRLVDIFVRKKIISKSEAASLWQVREIRNEAVHSEQNYSKEEAEYVGKIVDEIGKKISEATIVSGYMESSVFNFVEELFPKHHIKHCFNTGQGNRVDFVAEGPEHRYFIEIKSGGSRFLIDKAIKQIESLLTRESDRGLLIIPFDNKEYNIINHKIKFLYFDFDKNKLLNKDEIINWIYTKESTKNGK